MIFNFDYKQLVVNMLTKMKFFIFTTVTNYSISRRFLPQIENYLDDGNRCCHSEVSTIYLTNDRTIENPSLLIFRITALY